MVSALFGDTTSILAFICFVFDWRVYPCSSIVFYRIAFYCWLYLFHFDFGG